METLHADMEVYVDGDIACMEDAWSLLLSSSWGKVSNMARLTIVLSRPADPSARKVMYNLPYQDMHAPIVGPAHPFQKDGLAAGMKNHFSGHVEVRALTTLYYNVVPNHTLSYRFCIFNILCCRMRT